MEKTTQQELEKLLQALPVIAEKQDIIIANQQNILNNESVLFNLYQSLNLKLHEAMKNGVSDRYELLDKLERLCPAPSINHCPICGTLIPENAKTFISECIFNGGKLNRKQCPNCELIFGPEKMFGLSQTALNKEYEYHYKLFNEGDSYEAERRAFFDLNPSKDGLYLNYGGGSWSNTVSQLRAEGYNVYNYEPYSNPKEEFTICDRKVLTTAKFDGIFSHDLLEHLRYPIEELQFMSTLLNDKAIMNHVTGCYTYKYEYTRFHLFFFLGQSKHILAQKSGLKIIDYLEESEYMSCKFIKNSQ